MRVKGTGASTSIATCSGRSGSTLWKSKHNWKISKHVHKGEKIKKRSKKTQSTQNDSVEQINFRTWFCKLLDRFGDTFFRRARQVQSVLRPSNDSKYWIILPPYPRSPQNGLQNLMSDYIVRFLLFASISGSRFSVLFVNLKPIPDPMLVPFSCFWHAFCLICFWVACCSICS